MCVCECIYVFIWTIELFGRTKKRPFQWQGRERERESRPKQWFIGMGRLVVRAIICSLSSSITIVIHYTQCHNRSTPANEWIWSQMKWSHLNRAKWDELERQLRTWMMMAFVGNDNIICYMQSIQWLIRCHRAYYSMIEEEKNERRRMNQTRAPQKKMRTHFLNRTDPFSRPIALVLAYCVHHQ